MKKLSKLVVVLLALTMIFAGVVSFAACGPTEECTSHVDANGDGKCDKCGKDVPKTPDIPDEPDVHECSFKCVICGGCLDETCEDPACATKCGDQENRTLYKFEGEDPHVELKGGDLGPLGIAKEEEYGATETYIGNFNANPGASIKYSIMADADAKANLIVSVCKRQVATIFTNVVATLVNGEMIDSPSRVPANGKTTDTWTEFEDVNLGCVNLVEGKNIIEFAIMDANVGSGYNFNNMQLKSETPVAWYEGPHECETKCPDCGKCKDYTCTEPACAEKCEDGWTDYTFSGLDSKVELGGGAFKNDQYIGGLNGPDCVGASVTFNLTVDAITFAGFNLESCHRPTAVKFNDAFKLTVNGTEVRSDALLPTGGAEWNDFDYTKLGYAKLKKGKNVIRIELISGDPNLGANIRGISVGTPSTVVDWYVDTSAVDYKFEAEKSEIHGSPDGHPSVASNNAASGGACVGGVYDVSLTDPGKYYLLFDVYATEATEATLYIGVSAAGTLNTNCFPISVNGEDKTVDKVIPQTGWDEFQEIEYNTVSLIQGKNTVKMTIGEGAIGNIDYIGFACEIELNDGKTAPAETTKYKFEAENADSNAWVPVDMLWKTERAEASGGWFVGHVNDASIGNPGEYYLSFDIYAAEATEATLYISLGIPNSINTGALPLTLNDAAVTVEARAINSLAPGGWEEFNEYEFTTLSLQKGKNTLKITIGSGAEANMDYISLASGVELKSTAFEA